MTRAISDLLGKGWKTPGGTVAVTQPGDIAVLAPTTAAVTESFGKPRRRVYAELADRCAAAGVPWFNPRGTRLADIPCVQQVLGLALECLDPGKQFLPGFVWDQASRHMDAWRVEARALINADPEPRKPHRLNAFVAAWQARTPQGRGRTWPREFPLMELLHELTVWIPELRNSPGFLYLEGLTRSLDQLGTLFGPRAVLISRDRWDKSVKMLYEEFFIPIALDEVDLDEEVLEVLPLDAVNAITFHQATASSSRSALSTSARASGQTMAAKLLPGSRRPAAWPPHTRSRTHCARSRRSARHRAQPSIAPSTT
jgi:DNA helicase-2/ATP-dependent DNA helicase PcrA